MFWYKYQFAAEASAAGSCKIQWFNVQVPMTGLKVLNSKSTDIT